MENQHLPNKDKDCQQKSTSDRKFVIFDLDGTLIDSFECALHCINHILLEYGCAQLNRKKISSDLAIHELLFLAKEVVKDKGIRYYEFKQKFDSLQYLIYSNPERYRKYYPTLMKQGCGMLLKSVSLGYRIVIITNKEQRAAIEILKYLYPTIDLIVLGRIKEDVLKSDGRKVLRRLKSHGLAIQNCIGYFGDSIEDIILAREIGIKSFNLMHRCESQKLNSLNI